VTQPQEEITESLCVVLSPRFNGHFSRWTWVSWFYWS